MEIVSLPLGKVFLNKANPRKSYKKDDIAGLWETIKENGLLHPVTARPHPDGDGTFQLVVGERRFRAHQYGKAKEINAIVRDLSDKECAEIMLVENIHREDVDPVDEAKAIAEAMKDGMTISEIAARLGKSKSWIAPRVVMAHMSDKILELYKAKKITSRHLFALATISDLETRDRLAEECAADCETVEWLKDEIDSLQRSVADFAWDLGLELSDSEGAIHTCSECPDRTSMQHDLFEHESCDKCLNIVCWKRKVSAFVLHQKNAAEAEGRKIVKESKENEARFGYGAFTKSESEIAALKEAGAAPEILIDRNTGKAVECWPVAQKVKSKAEIDAESAIKEQKDFERKEAKIQEAQREILVELVGNACDKIDDDILYRIIADAAIRLDKHSEAGKLLAEAGEFDEKKGLVPFVNAEEVTRADIRRAVLSWAISVIDPIEVEPKTWKKMSVDYKKSRKMAEESYEEK